MIRGMSAFAFFLAEVAMGVYFVTVIGLTPLQLVFVGTALEAQGIVTMIGGWVAITRWRLIRC